MKSSNLGQYSYWLGDHLATPSVAAMGLDTGAALKEGSVSRPAPSTCICIVQAATSGRPCLLSIQPTRRGQKVNLTVQPQPTLSWTILRTFMECHSIHFNFRWTGLPLSALDLWQEVKAAPEDPPETCFFLSNNECRVLGPTRRWLRKFEPVRVWPRSHLIPPLRVLRWWWSNLDFFHEGSHSNGIRGWKEWAIFLGQGYFVSTNIFRFRVSQFALLWH